MTQLHTSSAPVATAGGSSLTLTRSMTWLLALAVGIVVANLYYTQPLVAPISHSLGLSPDWAGFIVTLTQMGYGMGVLLIVPLADVLENKRLILTMLGLLALSVLSLGFVSDLFSYFVAAFLVGLGASTVQLLVPLAAHFSSEETRGQVVGKLMSGLMLGIMLSRPIASFLTDLISWHAVFLMSTVSLVVLAGLLAWKLPTRQPANTDKHYGKLIASMARLFVATPVLRRRGFYQGCLFAAFSLFWTATPLVLAGPDFRLSQTQIALFALAGIAGAVVAPWAGRFADRGHTRLGTFIAFTAGIAAFLISLACPLGSKVSLGLLVVAAILLDAGVTANLVLGQRAIFSLAPQIRGRLNGLYIAMIFVGGAAGSTLGAWAFARGGWTLTAHVGVVMPVLAMGVFATESFFIERLWGTKKISS